MAFHSSIMFIQSSPTFSGCKQNPFHKFITFLPGRVYTFQWMNKAWFFVKLLELSQFSCYRKWNIKKFLFEVNDIFNCICLRVYLIRNKQQKIICTHFPHGIIYNYELKYVAYPLLREATVDFRNDLNDDADVTNGSGAVPLLSGPSPGARVFER